MFNSLMGTITGKFPKQLFVETNGIEWDICVPDTNLDMFPSVGASCRVFLWLQHTDMLMNLYGFATVDERKLFLDLLKVDGVGPKGAIKIMSSVSSSVLAQVLDSGDLARLEKIPGVGKKTAGKMLLALKGKLSVHEENSSSAIKKNSDYSDVENSLVAMGYERLLVQQKISLIVEALLNDEKFTSMNQKEKEETIFRRAIVEMA